MKRAIDARVVNVDELVLEHFSAVGGKFESDAARVGPLVGARDLGYSYDVVPPGKVSCPFHSHRGQEEMFFIVSGTGTLRYGAETRPIRAGDVICCPTGGPETAHQIVPVGPTQRARQSVLSMGATPGISGPRDLPARGAPAASRKVLISKSCRCLRPSRSCSSLPAMPRNTR